MVIQPILVKVALVSVQLRGWCRLFVRARAIGLGGLDYQLIFLLSFADFSVHASALELWGGRRELTV